MIPIECEMKQENKSMNEQSRSNYRKPVKQPVVSVVIPVFNGARYLVDAVRSIQKNSYKQFEIILVDDGSTDTSTSICKKLTQKYKNVRFFAFPKNKGLGRVLNYALKKARGEFICRLNQDDLMYPYRMERQVNYLLQHAEVVAVGSSIQLFNESGSLEVVHFPKDDKDIRRLWLLLSPFSDPSVMYRKSTAIRAGGYEQRFWPADDVHLWYRLGRLGKLANIARPLSKIRWHDEAASVKYFRIDTKRTFQLHLWAHEFVSPAPWYVWLFWLCQFIAGITLSPQSNWRAYRSMKRLIKHIKEFQERLEKYFQPNTTAATVTTQPKRLNLSGV